MHAKRFVERATGKTKRAHSGARKVCAFLLAWFKFQAVARALARRVAAPFLRLDLLRGLRSTSLRT